MSNTADDLLPVLLSFLINLLLVQRQRESLVIGMQQ